MTVSLQGMSGDAGDQTLKLRQQLSEAQNEASATKEELNGCKESLEKLQELLQVRSCFNIAVNDTVTHHLSSNAL